MRILALIILLSLTLNVFGQLQLDIENTLSTKNFSIFKKYVDSLSNQKKRIRIYWETEREITNDFEESILTVQQFIPQKKDSNICNVITFRVNILSTNNTILFYDLMEEKSKKEDNEWVEYFQSIITYQNDSLFKKLEINFLNSFGGQLNKQQLFTDSVIYGSRCGKAPSDPIERFYLDNFIELQDKVSLLKWLQSTNVETQLYAVEGFYKLKKAGYKINDNELLFIKNILKRKGTARTCGGCTYRDEKIIEIAKKFKF